MELEKLNKSQIVLLTLFCSFITSIATGIVTISLMQQAPVSIAQTVNRVIEHTVEKVVSTTAAVAAAPAAQEKTVIVKESDAIAVAVQKISPSIVRLYASDAPNPFVALGVVVDKSGTIITDKAALDDISSLTTTLADGTVVSFIIATRDQLHSIVYLIPSTTTKATWSPASLGSNPLLGQTLVAISGKSSTRVLQGIVSALPTAGDTGSIGVIETNIGGDAIIAGTPLVNTDGSVVGFSTDASRTVSASAFLPIPATLPSASSKEQTH